MRCTTARTAAAALFLAVALPQPAVLAWFDETHLAVARAAGYRKWFNAAGADIAKLKAGDREGHNHFVNNPPGTVVTAETVLGQADRYNQVDPAGHLYGAIIASVRDYVSAREKGRYGEFHLAYAAHYIGDLSQPLHHTLYDDFNKRNHLAMDGAVNEDVLDHVDRIAVYAIDVRSESDLAREIARIANLSMRLGYRLRDEDRMLGREEAYRQLSHSASLMKAVLRYVAGKAESSALPAGPQAGERRGPPGGVR